MIIQIAVILDENMVATGQTFNLSEEGGESALIQYLTNNITHSATFAQKWKP